MKAARLVSFREPLAIEQIPDPTPGPNDIVIQVEAVGVCRSDWHAWRGDWSWIGLTPKLPITPGHEMAGRIVAIGKEVKHFRVGDRVTSPFHEGCGGCPHCLTGLSNRCDSMGIMGFTHDGGFAEFVRVPNGDFNCLKLPDAVDAVSAAALGCRYMTSYRAVVDQGRVKPGEWVVIHGAGGVGLAAAQIARAMGAQVVVVSHDPNKLELATREGAHSVVPARDGKVTEIVREITRGGAHVSIEAVGIAETITNSVLSLRKGGRHVQVGLTTDNEKGMVSLPIDVMVAMEIEFVGSIGNPHAAYPKLLSMLESGTLRPKGLVGSQGELAGISETLLAMTTYRTTGFHVITKF